MNTKRAERRLAAILVADIVGYSRMMGTDETGTLRRLKRLRRELVDPQIAAAHGRIVKSMGDGLLVEFSSPVRAVTCAVRIQQAMIARELHVPREAQFLLRFGINIGDVVAEPDGDLYGDGVNVAARLEPLAEPGGVCVARSVYDQVRDKLPYPFEDKGKLDLKNIARPIGVYALSAGIIRSIVLPKTEDDEDDELEARAGEPKVSEKRDGIVLRKQFYLGSRNLTPIYTVIVAALGFASAYWFSSYIEKSRAREIISHYRPVIAVMNFDDHTGDVLSKRFVDGLTEETIAKLSHFRELSVLAKDITNGLSKAPDILTTAKQIGVDYFLEGSSRRVDSKLRFTAQLINAKNGEHIWASTYEKNAEIDSLMDVESELAAKIAFEVGGWSGAIANSELRANQSVDPSNMAPFACFAQANQALQRQIVTAATSRARACLEALVERDPNSAEGWAWLSTVLSNQRSWGTGLAAEEANDLDKRAYLIPRAIAAAARAVDLAPTEELPHFTLARAFYLSCNSDQLLLETQRTLSINANDVNAMGTLGTLLAWTGRWDIGVAYVERALALAGPTAPKWWWWVNAKDHWRRNEYQDALEAFQKSYVEQNWISHLHMAYTLPFLGKVGQAKAHVNTLLKLKPDFTVRMANAYYEMWCFDADYRNKMMEALRTAGLPE